MRRPSLAGISPWSTGTWRIRPGEIKLIRPEVESRSSDGFSISPSMKGSALVPFGNRNNKEAIVITLGIMAGFIFGAIAFFSII